MSRKANARRGVTKERFASMSGFGQGRASSRSGWVEVEIRTVNHRYFDFSARLPRGFSELQGMIEGLCRETLQRGHIDLILSASEEAVQPTVRFNRKLVEAMERAYLEEFARRKVPAGSELRASVLREVMARREAFEIGESALPGAAAAWRPLVTAACRKALAAVVAMRDGEGARIGADVAARFARLEQIAAEISHQAQRAPQRLRDKLLARLKDGMPEIDFADARLTAEVALLAEKCDVTEEIVRLGSHFTQARACRSEMPNGRKLEFLLQEIGREFNTIGSKAQESAIQHLVIDAKSEIEKVREQLQNLV